MLYLMRISIRRLVILAMATCSFSPCLVSTLSGQDTLAIPSTDDGLPGAGPIRRYDWFQRLWLDKRTAWAERVQADQHAVVFLGDSITQGWGDDLAGAFGDLKVANRGISGDTTRGMLVRLQQDVLSLNPRAIVLLAGTNDLEEKAEPPTIADNIGLLVERMREHNAEMPIVICQVFPSSAQMRRPAEKIKALNQLIQAKVKGVSHVTVLDTWTLFADEQGDAGSAEFPDLLHPNEAGYKQWAAALRPILATLGLVEVEAEAFTLEAGYESLFNGKDLTGWCLLPTTDEQKKAAENWKKGDRNAPPWPIVEQRVELNGQASSPDGRYQAIAGRLVVTIPTEGRRIQQLYTDREFPSDFTLKLEFRATPNADSGVFIRGQQLQCRDYALAGPYKELKQYRPQDWNELVIEVTGQSARCTCNGELLEASFAIPASGPLGLEGDRGQVEYRRIRIKLAE